MEAGQCRAYGIPENKVVIIPNGINLEELRERPARGEFRKKYGIKDGTRLILFLGRINKIKGLDLLAKAFAGLTKEMVNVKLVIAGPDDGYQTTLEKIFAGLGIKDRTIFTGPLYGADKAAAYTDADVYALASNYDTFPVSVLEAMAHGLPVVMTDRCGLASEIRDRAGLVTAYDSEKLSKALSKILNSPATGEEYGRQGQALVAERFNREKITSMLEVLYTAETAGRK